MRQTGIRTGIEVLLSDRRSEFSGARLGVVVHPASVLGDLRHSADVLSAESSFRVVSLFGPQHGARGEKQDNMVESEFYRDPDTLLPVHSLYGTSRKPTDAMLEDLDIVIFDLQDVGTRVYTFIHTMAYCMEACVRSRKKMVVLDRPNPINGTQVEGNLLDPDFSSFVGLYPIPMRHGMTTGELALLYNEEFGISCDLTVIPMEGWNRGDWFDHTGLPWVMPSPNLPTLDSATVYPGMVLVEGTMLSEGRGTTRPFELVGAPYIRPRHLAEKLNGLKLPGVFFRPAHFEPTFQKFAGEMCGGVQLHVLDRSRFEPVISGIAVIAAVRELYPELFAWRQPPYEYEQRKLPIEILGGGKGLRSMIETGCHPAEIRATWQQEIAQWRTRRLPYLLYD